MALTPLYKSPYVTDWSEHALTRFMSEFTMDTQDLSVSPGFLHNLPQLYQESNEKHSLLVQAVKAVSLVNLSNHTGSNDLALQAKRSYGTAISHLNKTLSAGDFQSDATLTAVLFLNYYQVCEASGFRSAYSRHHRHSVQSHPRPMYGIRIPMLLACFFVFEGRHPNSPTRESEA